MSNKEFWEEEPELLWAYRKSYMGKLELENEKMNTQCWLEGLYIYDAISTVAYNICKKESQPAKNYMESPIDIHKKPKTPEEIQKEEQLKLEEQIKESLRRTKNILKQNKERQDK